MTLRNTAGGYGQVARWLHWLTALCMLPALAIAVYMDSLHEKVPGDPQKYFAVLPWHKTLGFLVLCLLVLRLPWYLRSIRPQFPAGMSRWQRVLAHVVHGSLYGLMFALPLLGWLGSSAGPSSFKLFTLWEMPRLIAKNQPLSSQLYDVHVVLGWSALALVVLHVGAALWHQWVAKDQLLYRMWPPAGPSS
jgi:cytochrome b561